MKKQPRPANLLLDLEARQEEVIARLEELDREVERVLAECLALKAAETAPDQGEPFPGDIAQPFAGQLRKAG
jgi:hypothetical protein